MIGLNKFFSKWERIRKTLNYPRLNQPIFLDEEEAKKVGMENEIAAINLKDNVIFVNKKNLEERVGREHLGRVIKHEIMHYLSCPRGLRNYVRMVGHADIVTRNLERAKTIQNLYSDLTINTLAARDGDKKGMVDLYRKLSEGNESSEAWQLYMATYENMTDCQGMIIPKPKEEIRIKAKKLADIVNDAMGQSNKWPDSIKKFAEIIQEYMKKDEKKKKDIQKQDQGKCNPGQTAPQDVPDITKGLISRHDAKDFIPYDPKKVSKDQIDKKVEAELKGLSKELGPKEFKRVLAGTGIVDSKEANVWLYRELARNYTLFLPQVKNHRAGEFKNSPKKWNIGDPLSKLDYVYSYSRSPILIPNVTTYKWDYKNGESFGNGKEKPDLLVVIDSSISMPDPRKDMSFPVLSAMVAAHSALSYGSSVAIVNFSSDFESCKFTNQTKEIDRLIVKYYGGGTEIPGKEMVRLSSNRIYPVHTIIISDTDIANLDAEIGYLEKNIKNCRAGGSIFLCCSPSDKTRKLKKIGYDIKFARDFKDLGKLTLDKTKELYT